MPVLLDPSLLIGEILESPWLLPLLALAVLADGPFPFLPSEPLLFAATATAAAADDTARIVALFAAATLGSLLGDLLLFCAGRSSHRIVAVPRRAEGSRAERISARVRRHLHRRPIVALATVRLVPGGRLAGVTAAGRARVPWVRFLPATLISSTLWAAYMTAVGLAISPLTGGDPLLSLLAGLVSALIIGGVLEGARRIAAVVAARGTT